MNDISTKADNWTENIKLYSNKAIGIATFIGGPLAAGYLVFENYKALGKPALGKNILLIGIGVSIILFTALFMIPENLLDRIPRQVLPGAYTFIIWGLVEWKLGDILKAHKEKGNAFYSAWRAAGIGLISLLVIMSVIFGYVFLGTDDEIYDRYDTELSVFSKNEVETLEFYDHLDTEPSAALVRELEYTIIPKWRENIEIIRRTDHMEDLPGELAAQNKLLMRYSELRIQAFETFKKAIEEDTYAYGSELERIHSEIDAVLAELN